MATKFEKIAVAMLGAMTLLTLAWVFVIQPSGPAQPELASTALTLIFGGVIPVLLIALIIKKQKGFKAAMLMALLYVLLGAATIGRGMENSDSFGQTTLIAGAIATLIGLVLILALKKASTQANPFEEAEKVASG